MHFFFTLVSFFRLKIIFQSYPIENISPTLEGDALEDREHGKTKVVKVSDAIVWTLPKLAADMASLCVTFVVASAECGIIFVHHFA